MSRLAMLVASGTIAMAPAAAWAQPTDLPVVLTWKAPDDCPTARDVEADVAELLARVPAREDLDRRVAANASVERRGEGYLLQLTIDNGDGKGHREVEDASCERLAEAAALIVAIAYDPAAADATAVEPLPPPPAPKPPPVPAPAPSAPAPPAPAEPALTEPAPAAPSGEPKPIDVIIGLQGLGAFGALPKSTLGLGLRVGLGLGWLTAAVEGEWWVGGEASLREGPAGADFAFAGGGLSVCADPWRPIPSLHLGGCARLSLGWMNAAGFGVDIPGEESALWVAAGPGLVARVELLPWLDLRTEADVLLAALRPTWRLTNVGTIDDPGLASTRLALGMDVRF